MDGHRDREMDRLDQMPSVALQSACRRLRPDDQSPFALPSASALCVLTDWPAPAIVVYLQFILFNINLCRNICSKDFSELCGSCLACIFSLSQKSWSYLLKLTCIYSCLKVTWDSDNIFDVLSKNGLSQIFIIFLSPHCIFWLWTCMMQ